MSELAKRLREVVHENRRRTFYYERDVPLAAIADLVEAVGRDLEPSRSIAQQILDGNRVGEAYDALAQAMKEVE